HFTRRRTTDKTNLSRQTVPRAGRCIGTLPTRHAARESSPMKAPLPINEASRLEALRAYDVLDTPPEQAFDDLTRLASQICDAPVAMVSLVDGDRQWVKSKVGTDATQTPRAAASRAHASL